MLATGVLKKYLAISGQNFGWQPSTEGANHIINAIQTIHIPLFLFIRAFYSI